MKRALLVMGLLGAVLMTVGSADARFEPGLNRVAADKGEIFRQGCLLGSRKVASGPCRFGDPESKKKVVLFGDSHAMHWGPGLIRLAKAKGWQVIALTRASCPAALVSVDFFCDTWRRKALRRIRLMRPGLTVVASAAHRDAYEVLVNGYGVDRYSSEPYLVNGMVQTLRRLRTWSRKTVVLRDQAVTPFNITNCLRSSPVRPARCGFRPQRPREFAYDYKATRRVLGVPLIDPQPMLCPDGWCLPVQNNILVYRNFGHLSATFTRSKYQWLGYKLGDPWRGTR